MVNMWKQLAEFGSSYLLFSGTTNSSLLVDEEGKITQIRKTAPCYGYLQNDLEEYPSSRYLVSAIIESRNNTISNEHKKCFLKWMVEESPFKDIFVDGWTVDDILRTSIIIRDMSKMPANVFGFGCIVERSMWEQPSTNVCLRFKSFVDAGVSGDMAFILSLFGTTDGKRYERKPFLQGHMAMTEHEVVRGFVRNFLNHKTDSGMGSLLQEGKYYNYDKNQFVSKCFYDWKRLRHEKATGDEVVPSFLNETQPLAFIVDKLNEVAAS